MDIILESMSEAAYSAFYRMSFENHTAELMRKEGLSRDAAELETENELLEMLPDGLQTADNYLLIILYRNEIIGYLWFLTEFFENRKQAFLCDFLIYDGFRGRSFGREALEAMEEKALELQCKEVVLFAEEDNTIALRLYAKAGYTVEKRHNYGFYLKKCLR